MKQLHLVSLLAQVLAVLQRGDVGMSFNKMIVFEHIVVKASNKRISAAVGCHRLGATSTDP